MPLTPNEYQSKFEGDVGKWLHHLFESRHGEAVIISGGYESAVSPQSESEACGAEVIDNPSLVGMHHPQFFTNAHLLDSAEASAFQEAQAFMKIKQKGLRGYEADVEWFLTSQATGEDQGETSE